MQPIPANLRPMNLSDIIDATFRLYRANFFLFLGIAALAQMPFLLAQLVLGLTLDQSGAGGLFSTLQDPAAAEAVPNPAALLPMANMGLYMIASGILAILQALVVQQLASGALANAIARRYLGMPTSVLGAYSLGGGRIGALLGVGLLAFVVSFFAVAIIGGLAFAFMMLTFGSAASGRQSDGSMVLMSVMMVLLIFAVAIGAIVLSLFITLRFIFTTQSIVLEGRGVFESLRRSWQLVGGSFMRVFGIIFVIGIMVQFIIFVPVMLAGLVINIFLTPVNNPFEHYALRQALTNLVSYGAQMIVLPLTLAAQTLLYYDLRIRKEGYDLQLRAQEYAFQEAG